MSKSFLFFWARWETILFIGGLAATIAFQLLTRRMDSSYLLYGMRKDGTRYFSPERVQLLVVTIGIAFEYLLNAAHTASGNMPSLPDGSLELLGVSNVIYLGGKGWAAYKEKLFHA